MEVATLSAAARVRLVPIAPALDAATGARLLAAIDKLFAQFAREERVVAWGSQLLAQGAVLLVAWEAAGAQPLSGCSHDRLGRLLMTFEDEGRVLLNAPPLVVELRPAAGSGSGLSTLSAAEVLVADRSALRRLAAAGELTPHSLIWDLQVATLGELRNGCRTILAGHPLAARLWPVAASALPERS